MILLIHYTELQMIDSVDYRADFTHIFKIQHNMLMLFSHTEEYI
jgi:hypothetical protein